MKTLQKSILRTWKGVDKMRVSDNMTNEMAKKAGLPINMRGAGESTKNTLLEALDNKKIEDDYFTDSAVDTKKMKELTKTADNLIDIAETFDTDVKNNKLFEEAKNNNDMSNVIEKTKSFASSYNDLLKSLSSNNDGLFSLYYSELKNAYSDYKNEFADMGITFDKNGYMSVDEEKLKGADLDLLQGYMGDLSHKANFLASRVSDNASAQAESISNRYDAYGNIFSQGTSRYDYFG